MQGPVETGSSGCVGGFIYPDAQRPRAIAEVGADPGWIGPIEVAARVSNTGVVKTEEGRRDRTGLVDKDAAHLPPANQCIQGFVSNRQQPAGSDRQFVECRAEDPIPHVERGRAVIAGEALVVLGEQIVISLTANAAGIVEGFGPGV